MNRILLTLSFYSILFFSCTKGTATHPAAPGQAVLLSGTVTSRFKAGFVIETDSLLYNQSGAFAGFVQFFRDSGDAGEDHDTAYYLMSAGDPSSPSEFSALSYAFFDSTQVDHSLYYDGESRIVLDTNTQGWVNHYQYGADYILSNSYNPNFQSGTNGTGESYKTDTFYLESGNIVKRSESLFSPPSPGGLPGLTVTQMEYSNYPNPFYLPNVSKNIGIFLNSFLLYPQINDFVSPNIRTLWAEDSQQPASFSWNLDSAGRVSSGSGTFSNEAFTIDYRYKN